MKLMIKLFGKKGFNKAILTSLKSDTYKKFCIDVYDIDLCQLNMMDLEQLTKLIEILNLSEASKVLDVGCGAGIVSEYISSQTGCKIKGIDFIRDVMRLASNRAEGNDKVSFEEKDFNKLNSSFGKFDGIISIDTLYFSNNLEQTINTFLDLLKPHGQMALFYTSRIKDGQPKELLESKNTKLAKVLESLDLKFKAWNFTRNEHEIWEKTITVCEKLKADFIDEGNIDIYKSRIQEAQNNLKWKKNKSVSRYLYHVTLS